MDHTFSRRLDDELRSTTSKRTAEIERTNAVLQRRFNEREKVLSAAEEFLKGRIVPKLLAVIEKFRDRQEPTISRPGAWGVSCGCQIGDSDDRKLYINVVLHILEDRWEWSVAVDALAVGGAAVYFNAGSELIADIRDVPSGLEDAISEPTANT
jgi:hypothetical protein